MNSLEFHDHFNDDPPAGCRRVCGGDRPFRWGARIVVALTVAMVALAHSTVAWSQKNRTAAELNVFPKTIVLDGARGSQAVIGQLVYDDEITSGVTDQIHLEIADQKIARIESGKVYPVSDGVTMLTVSVGNFSETIPVTVQNSDSDPPISFQLDVMPVFSKTGCNAGSCHGAARGKDGFRLSLFGYDAKGDYFRLTREMPGRRIDVAIPDDCLLTNKATNRVAHSGGKLFEPDSQHYAVLKRWLQEGATFDNTDVARCTSIELSPPHGLLNGTGATEQLHVMAHYSDRTQRDVTHLAVFSTTNPDAASVSQTGEITAGRRGEAFVMARFDTHTVGSEFITLPRDLEFESSDDRYSENNFIDTHVNTKLKRLRIYPSPLCTDAQFIRRVNIDLCGRLPTSAEVKNFVADRSPEKRSQLIDQLIERDEFLDIWIMKWAELLQIRASRNVDAKAALLYFQWLKEKFYRQTPLNEIVVELLSATGGTFENPPTNFYEIDRDPLKTAENVAQVFLGMRIQCAQCHNHPFDRWTMEDYYSFAAFFAKVRSKPTADPRRNIVSHGGGKEIKHPVSNKKMQPTFLGGMSPAIKGGDRRQSLADWIAAPDNPYFAKNVTNIMWAHFLGRGIVEEVDDVRISNPPVNAPLWEALADAFVKSNYDTKHMARLICNSRTYQLSSVANASNQSDLTNFSHALLRRMRAEVLLDVLAEVTNTQNQFKGLPLGARATEIADGNTTNYFLKTFGRSTRTSVCSCEVKQEPNLSQALHLLNGDTVNEKIKKGNLILKWGKQGLSAESIVRQIYMRTIAREPTAKEMVSITKLLNQAKMPIENRIEARGQSRQDDSAINESAINESLANDSPENIRPDKATVEKAAALSKSSRKQSQAAERKVLEDLFWAMLNSSEFLFNH